MKKLISIILASAMTVSVFAASVSAVEYGEEYANKPTNTYSQKFNDVPASHWAFSYVGEMTERGVVSGYPNGNFYPDNKVTRAEFARIMTSASGLPISTPQTRDFSDVATDAWYAPYIHAAYPYLSGYQIYGGNYYKPDTPALREDIAVALVKLKGYDTLGADESILTTMFTDANSISSEARKYVAVALERGLVSGYDDNTFRGQDSISRAEATAMLWRAYQYGNDNKTFDNVPTAAPIITPAPTPINYERDDNDWKPSDEPVTTPAPTYAATEKPIVTVEPTVAPTEKPIEKPYVMDTVTKADIDNTFTMMTTDDDYIYYYDEGDNTVYSINMESERKSEVLDVSEIEIEQEKDEDSDNDVVEHYKDFEVEQLYYDYEKNALMLSGTFRSITDYYGLKDKNANYDAIINVTENCSLCSKNDMNEPTVFVDYFEMGFKIKDGNSLYKFSRIDTGWHGISSSWGTKLAKYNFNSNEWEVIRESEIDGTHIGLYNDNFYVWSLYNGSIVKCATNTKLTLLDINTSNNVEVIDFKNMPKHNYYGHEQIILKDEHTIFFYDKDTSSIRVIKER